MKKYSLYIYTAAYLSIIIPTPGRFVYGTAVIFEMFLFTILGILFNKLISKINFNELRSPLLLMFLIFLTILYRQIFVLTQTEVALTLGFIFYIPPVSLFIIAILINDSEKELKFHFLDNIKKLSFFCIFGLIFFLFRDVSAFGTFTFFGNNHQIYEKILFHPKNAGFFTFLATIPGALIFSGIFLLAVNCIDSQLKKIKNLKKAEKIEVK